MFYPSVSINQFRVSPTKGDHADPVYSGRKVKTGCAMEAISKKTDFPDEIAIKLNFNLSILKMSHEEQQKEIAQANFQKAAQWAPAGKGSFSGAMEAAMTPGSQDNASFLSHPEYIKFHEEYIQKLKAEAQLTFGKAARCEVFSGCAMAKAANRPNPGTVASFSSYIEPGMPHFVEGNFEKASQCQASRCEAERSVKLSTMASRGVSISKDNRSMETTGNSYAHAKGMLTDRQRRAG